MNEKIIEFYKKHPKYRVVNFINNYSILYFYDENNILHSKNNIYRALNFKIGIESAVNKVEYMQIKLNNLKEKYTLIKYGGIKGKSIIKHKGFTYHAVLYDLLQGHDVSKITCIDINKSNISKSKKCGFSKDRVFNLYLNSVVNFYLINIYNDNESFFKVGLTKFEISRRFSQLHKFNYKYKIINNIKIPGREAYDIENNFKKEFKNYKYMPKTNYPGYTESFNKQIVKEYEKYKNNYSGKS